MKHAYIVYALVMAFAASPASAEVIASCGELKGHSYYPTGLHVPRSQSGWQEDKIGGGQTFITATKTAEGLEYDVVFKDYTQNLKSLRSQGFLVQAINADDRTVHILAVHFGNATEMYVLDREQRVLSLLSYKMRPLRLTRAMVSKCE